MQVASVLGLVAVCYVPVLALLGAVRAMGGGSASGDESDDEVPVYSWDGDGETETDSYHTETVLGGETPEPPADEGTAETPEPPTDEGTAETPDVSVHCPQCGTVNDSRFAYCQECVRPLSKPSMASD